MSGGIPQNLAPLRIHARCVSDFPTLKQNITYACELCEKTHKEKRAKPIRLFVPTPEPHDMEAVLVGSGPSVREQVGKLKKLRKQKNALFFGIKGGHDFLLEHKIEPHFGVAVDPLEKIHKENFLRKAKNCKYFIASQCHPTLFDTLLKRDEEILIWHLATDNLNAWSQQEESPVFRHYMIPGGSTSGLRCLVLAYSMGFRRFHLFGYDSCLAGENLRKVGGETYEKTDKIMSLHVMGKEFRADPAMASQANEFQTILDQLKGSGPFTVKGYGRGLIQHLIRERYRQGQPECRV